MQIISLRVDLILEVLSYKVDSIRQKLQNIMGMYILKGFTFRENNSYFHFCLPSHYGLALEEKNLLFKEQILPF